MAIMFESKEFLQYLISNIGIHVDILKKEFLIKEKEYYIKTLNHGEFYITQEDMYEFINNRTFNLE